MVKLLERVRLRVHEVTVTALVWLVRKMLDEVARWVPPAIERERQYERATAAAVEQRQAQFEPLMRWAAGLMADHVEVARHRMESLSIMKRTAVGLSGGPTEYVVSCSCGWSENFFAGGVIAGDGALRVPPPDEAMTKAHELHEGHVRRLTEPKRFRTAVAFDVDPFNGDTRVRPLFNAARERERQDEARRQVLDSHDAELRRLAEDGELTGIPQAVDEDPDVRRVRLNGREALVRKRDMAPPAPYDSRATLGGHFQAAPPREIDLSAEAQARASAMWASDAERRKRAGRPYMLVSWETSQSRRARRSFARTAPGALPDPRYTHLHIVRFEGGEAEDVKAEDRALCGRPWREDSGGEIEIGLMIDGGVWTPGSIEAMRIFEPGHAGGCVSCAVIAAEEHEHRLGDPETVTDMWPETRTLGAPTRTHVIGEGRCSCGWASAPAEGTSRDAVVRAVRSLHRDHVVQVCRAGLGVEVD